MAFVNKYFENMFELCVNTAVFWAVTSSGLRGSNLSKVHLAMRVRVGMYVFIEESTQKPHSDHRHFNNSKAFQLVASKTILKCLYQKIKRNQNTMKTCNYLFSVLVERDQKSLFKRLPYKQGNGKLEFLSRVPCMAGR